MNCWTLGRGLNPHCAIGRGVNWGPALARFLENEYIGACLTGGATAAILGGSPASAGAGCLVSVFIVGMKQRGGKVRSVAIIIEYYSAVNTLTRAAVKGILRQNVPTYFEIASREVARYRR